MPRVSPIQNAFNSGEFSPRLEGRTDLGRYRYAAERIENFLILPQGGLRRRSGSRFVAEVKDSTIQGRLIPFIFSNVQAYALEWGNLRLRFFANEGLIQAATNTWTPTEVDTAADTIRILGGHFYVDQQGPFRLTTAGSLPAPLATGTDYYIKTTADPEKFQLSLTPGGAAENLTSTGAGTSTIAPFGVVPCEVVTPYTEAQLAAVAYAQSADVLYLVHTAHAPRKLSRIANDKWTLAAVVFIDGPYLTENTDTTKTLTPSATTGAITITAVGHAPFLAGRDEGRLVRIRNGATWGYATITSVTSSTVVNATVNSAFAGVGADSRWRLGAWYVGNFPGAVTFFEERLGFGGDPNAPQTFYGSRTGDFENFAPTALDNTITDDHAITYTIAANDVNNIVWMGYSQSLILGTAGGIWVAQGTTNLEPITPTNVVVRRNSAQGSKRVIPAYVEDLVTFLSSTGRAIRAIDFSGDQGSQHTIDLTVYARHVTDSLIAQISYAQEPNSVIWAARFDGILFGLTLAQIGSEEPVIGWSRHRIGGSFGTRTFAPADVSISLDEITLSNHGYPELFGPVRFTSTGFLPGGIESTRDYWIKRISANAFRLYLSPEQTTTVEDIFNTGTGTHTITPVDAVAIVESITTIPSPLETHSQSWILVKRTINGATRRYVEFFEDEFEDVLTLRDAFFLDSGISAENTITPQTTWGGLSHLEGQTVDALADGSAVQNLVVTGGQITLATAATKIHVGLRMVSKVKSLRLLLPDPEGSDQGKRRRIDSLILRLHRTIGGKSGRDESNLSPLIMSEAGDPLGEPSELFSGDFIIRPFAGDWDENARVVVVQDSPYPFQLAAWMPQVRSSER